MRAPVWHISAIRSLTLDIPRLVGIINATPDSFSDGGLALDPKDAARRSSEMVEQGVDVLDIGAESTRPGAQTVPPREQIERAVPVIEAIRSAGLTAPITIDTTSAAVARAALDAGADAINDVSGADGDPEMLPLAAERDCSIILMHRLTAPDQESYSHEYARDPRYEGGVVESVRGYLLERARAAEQAGVRREGIVLDPGFGFGKSVEQNVELMRSMRAFVETGYPVLAGVSRKSFIGAITGESEPARRLFGSVGAAVTMAESKVRIFRVHDVAPHRQALQAGLAASQTRIEPMEQTGAGSGSQC